MPMLPIPFGNGGAYRRPEQGPAPRVGEPDSSPAATAPGPPFAPPEADARAEWEMPLEDEPDFGL